MVCVLACAGPFASAQPGGYAGPGVLSRGAGDIGTRAGSGVDFRFFGDINAVYDSGLQPYSLNPEGNLTTVSGLYGVQVDLGAYGTHRWKRALLGLDYNGNFFHYDKAPQLDGINQNLLLGFTYQKSRRITFDFKENVGISNQGYGSPGFYSTGQAPTDFVTTPTAALFDNRFFYLQTTMDVNLVQSARTIYTLGGDGFWVRRQGVGLADVNGYNLRGSMQHRLSKNKTIGVTYQHTHFDFPPAFGESDINEVQAFYSAALNKRWTFNVGAGASMLEVQGIEAVKLDPVIAALLGTSTGERAFYQRSFFPSGQAALSGRFKTSSISFSYSRTVTPGNGLYLTSRQNGGYASYSYTGIRRWSLSLTGGYTTLQGVGQSLQPYSTFTGGFGATYRLARAFHVNARFDARDQQIDVVGYKNNGYRATLGLAFAPGTVPLTLW